MHYEVIIVDDASPDRSVDLIVEIFNKFAFNNFQIVRHSENFGQSVARNKGLEFAAGEYIMFLDADDYFPNDSCLKVFIDHALQADYDFIAAYCDKVESGEQRLYNRHAVRESMDLAGDEVLHALVSRKIDVMPWNKLYKSDFLKIHDFKFLEGRIHEDELWTFQICALAIRSIILPQVTYVYNRENTLSTNGGLLQKEFSRFFGSNKQNAVIHSCSRDTHPPL